MHTGHCDHCKEPISMGDACVIEELSRKINHADKGAYAIVCADCDLKMCSIKEAIENMAEDND